MLNSSHFGGASLAPTKHGDSGNSDHPANSAAECERNRTCNDCNPSCCFQIASLSDASIMSEACVVACQKLI